MFLPSHIHVGRKSAAAAADLGELYLAVDPGLPVDALDMGLNRGERDAEPVRGLLVAETFGYQPRDLQLTGAETVFPESAKGVRTSAVIFLRTEKTVKPARKIEKTVRKTGKI